MRVCNRTFLVVQNCKKNCKMGLGFPSDRKKSFEFLRRGKRGEMKSWYVRKFRATKRTKGFVNLDITKFIKIYGDFWADSTQKPDSYGLCQLG
jgi:hypothetical protein